MGGLVALHILVLVVILARAASLAPADADVARANRIATSPAIAYRNFPVEFMPVQTLFDRALGSGDVADAARRIALVAFLADMAAAVGAGVGLGTAAVGHLPAARTAAAVVPVPAVRSRRGRPRRVGPGAAPPAARGTRRRRTRSRRDGQALAVGAGAGLCVPSGAARPARRGRGLSRDRGLVVPHRRPEGAVPGAVVPRHPGMARGEPRRAICCGSSAAASPIGRPMRSASATPPLAVKAILFAGSDRV